MLGARKNPGEVRFREVRAKHQEPSEVELVRGQRIEQRRKAPDETRSCYATKCLVFREAELVDAVGVEARAGARAVDATGFHLGEVGEELGQDLIRAPYETACTRKQLSVREVLD
jgi:hypothetical protein